MRLEEGMDLAHRIRQHRLRHLLSASLLGNLRGGMLRVLQILSQPTVDTKYLGFLEVNGRHQVPQAPDDRAHTE